MPAVHETAEEIPEVQAGPAMKLLTEKQAAFVMALVHGHSKTQAAKIAGYAGDRAVLKSVGWLLARNPKVISAVREVSEQTLVAHAGLATSTLVALLGADNEGVRLRAAIELLDRSGLIAPILSQTTVVHSKTDEEKHAEVQKLCDYLGLSFKELQKAISPYRLPETTRDLNKET